MALAGSKGDLFWDLAVPVIYVAGSELPCVIEVANPDTEDHEYMLMTRIQSDSTVIGEEAVRVDGGAYFMVEAGDKRTLSGVFSFNYVDVTLTLLLYLRGSEDVVDSVSTSLVTPSTATALWPPGWPIGITTGTEWGSMFDMMLPLLMVVMMMGVLTSAFRDREELPEGQRGY